MRACFVLASVALTFLCFSFYPVQADLVRLSNGTIIEGQIVRDDDNVLVILVNGVSQFYTPEDITAVIYSHIRLDPRSSRRPLSAQPHRPKILMDTSVVAKIRERLLTYHGFVIRAATVAEHLRWQDYSRAGPAAQRAAKWVLPTYRGDFSPFSALADILILLGLRAPTLWLALNFIREPRAFTRICEFFVPAYGFLMLMMVCVTATPLLWLQISLFPVAVIGVGLLFAWMFALTPGRALLAFSLALAMNVATEALLIHYHWLSAGLQGPLQLAQR